MGSKQHLQKYFFRCSLSKSVGANYNNITRATQDVAKNYISDKISLPIAKAKIAKACLYERMGYKLISRPIVFPFKNWSFLKFLDKKKHFDDLLEILNII